MMHMVLNGIKTLSSKYKVFFGKQNHIVVFKIVQQN